MSAISHRSSTSSSKSSTRRSSSSHGTSRTRSTQKTSSSSQARKSGRSDSASVSKEAHGPKAANPVNFGAWSGGLLKSGARGGDVASLQKSLNEKMGGKLDVDGKFGKKTRAAVEQFQREHNLKVDGLAGEETRKALMGNAAPAPRQPQVGEPDKAAKGVDKVDGPNKTGAANQAEAANQAQAASKTPAGKSAFGEKLAKDARRIAESGVAGRGHNCKRGVRMALEKQGMKLDGVSAYMAADQLAKNKKFSEMKGLQRGDLKNLPPGATVVWNRSKGHPHGHISIAMGNGREASDVMRNQIVNYPSSYRVFMPN